MNRWIRLLKHRWTDPGDSRRAVPDAMARRLADRVAASEARHSGQIRFCVEAALPTSALLRIGPDVTLADAVRDRALGWFGRLRLWDTEQNNGVLIYLLLAEHAIEFVADRGLARQVSPADWQHMVGRLSKRLSAGDMEGGLTQALEEVSALLVLHFPAGPQAGVNEHPDAVVRV